MCGIVGYIGPRDAVPIVLDSLKRLEYRGYDSAGLAVIQDGGLQARRSVGKIANLESLLLSDPVRGTPGVGHTRWATHGKPSDENAHPHRDCSGTIAVVHNGIIENYLALRTMLEAEGHVFKSETDSEVVAHLVEHYLDGDFEGAVRRAAAHLRGAYALALISQRDPERLVALRSGGPPLVVGVSGEGLFIASDVAAILGHTRDVLIPEDGEMAVLSPSDVRLLAADGRAVHRATSRIPWDATAAQKNEYPHFMLKEIYEQPRAIENTFHGRIELDTGEVRLPEAGLTPAELARIRRILIIACGTSWHAGLVGKYMLEALAPVPVEVDVGSECRYRAPIVDETTLAIAISQSGETADTLGALREAKGRGAKVLGICNVVGSSLSREADGVIHTHAGPEIGVASTKAFTTQVAALYLLAIHFGRAQGSVSPQQARGLLQELTQIPALAERVLERDGDLGALAWRFHRRPSFLYLGRGINYPLALEGALKLKEISYIHAEGYPAGEMKHGPIALIDRRMPVVVLAPRGRLYDKILGAIQEVKSREGQVIALASEDDETIVSQTRHVVRIPPASELLQPLLLAIPLQLFAYHVAVLRGCDVDQPRNLAKSVTVE